MRVNQFLVLISLANVTAFIRYDNPYVFVNRVYVNHTIFVIVTLQSLRGVWFLTKVSIEERIIDYFQTNASEHREQLLWYHTASLKQTLNFYGIFTQKNLPYQECFYHVSRANFFKSGFHNVSVLITTIGITSDKLRSSSYTYIDLDENVRCEPQFSIPQCVNADYPVHYEVSDIIVLRAMYTRRCPMDIFTQYYWTVHDSTERQLLGYLGGTSKPEIKIGRYKLNILYQSQLNRMVMVRLNARIVGRRIPLVARCYIALAPQRLYAIIRGGPSRKVFTGNSITIDGSHSRDLSLPKNAKQLLLFEWLCDSAINIEKVCKLQMGKGPAFTIPPFTQQGEQSIRFILNIRSTFDLLRSSVAMQTILFSSYPRLYIDAHCLSCKSMKITKWMWTVDHNLVSSSKRLLYYVSNKTSIIVYLNMEAIHRYKPSSKYQGSSTLRLERNYGPVHTACYVSPLDGEAIKTLFSIKCTNENALYKPLKYCLSVNSLLITECITDQLIISRLPAASHIEVQVCDNLDVCIIKNIGVNVRQAFIADTEVAVFNFLNRVRYWLKYADWSMSFVMLDQIILRINSKERLLVFTEALAVYQPQTPVQLAHLVQILIKILDHIIPLDDMIVNVLARILHIIESTFKIVIANAEQNTLMDCYYKKMVEAMFEILDKFATEWEYIPKSQCRAESESCLNVDNFRNRLEQMSTLNPQVLEHINNWLHAHWKLNNCLFYMGMGMARRIHPDENAKKKDCRTFLMTMESFDLDLERALVIKSADAMHTLIFTEKLLQELRHLLRNDEVLISIRSHKHSQYWWYPEQDSRTQVLVVNAYTSTAILEKTQQLSEPFQYISKLTTKSCTYQYCKGRRRRRKSIEFDDPVEDVENVIHDNVVSSKEVRMYRTELYGHSVLGVTFTKADIDYRVLLHMTNNPQLNDIETKNTTCLVKSGSKPTALLLRNLCKEARPVYIYIRAENILRNWDSFRETGAYYTFSTEMRSCRIWKFARPEPSWQTILCIPEMNKSVSNGIHCRCNFISDLDADAKPIIAVRMNLKCHLERPVVGRNYEIIICYIVIPIVAIAFLLIQMHRAAFWDKPLYLEDVYSGELCRCGDIIIRISFGGRYHSGSSANIFLLLQSSRGKREIFVHQDPVKTAFNRNCTIFLRLDREFVQLPVRLALGHDNTGTHPHYFCRSIVITDILTEKTQHFRINRWVRTSPGAGSKMHLESTMVLDFATTSPKSIYRWPSRFAIAFELCMGKWYLFQSIIGPWRFGINRNSLSRWERSCIYVGKNFVAICIVIIFFGRAEPILCDPSPKRYNDFNIVVWLCLICLTASCITEILMIIFLRMLSKYN
ncbi:uncharacterized protein LOC26527763 isoform X3 [Drosophila mojavensis]|uniref:uncharacterized protein LOC26527763 isoform X3 n=1 Tax=Drosophila mojavensis TaxID=7230 RepID=UPI0013EE631C|nr:uncharacterized protein LOC26527763 isoform X3 [Drosophila mojavensis]